MNIRTVKINWHWLLALLGVGIFVLALSSLYHTTQMVQWQDVKTAIVNIPLFSLLSALVIVFVGYWVLTYYDMIALRYLQSALPYSKISLISFSSYAIGHNVGFAVLSAGAIRYRFYSAVGLSPGAIARVIVLVSLTFTLGISAMSGLVLLIFPQTLTDIMTLPMSLVQLIGFVMMLIIAGFIAFSGKRGRTVNVKQWQFCIPPARILLMQTCVSVLDVLSVALVLYLLLPGNLDVSFLQILAAFVQSMVIAIISHVPGGLGVFEAAMLIALPQVPKDTLLAVLLVFRILYYFIPFCLALLVIIGHEWKQYGELTERWSHGFNDWLSYLLPQILGLGSLIAGAILLFSGVIPRDPAREALLGEWLPLSVIEASHLLASAAGFALLILAKGLFSRLDGAWHLTVWLLIAGIVASLVKGLDYEEALIMLVILALLFKGRKAFYHKAALMAQAFSPQWFLMIAVILAGSFWLGLFSYRHEEYNHDLWWTFAFDANSSRFMRATVLLTVLSVGFALYKLLRRSPFVPCLPDPAALQKARSIVLNSDRSDSALALLGDKYLLFSDSENSFLMYQIQGLSWIVMADPVGDEDEFEELLWAFRELSDLSGGKAVFYQISKKWLPLYIDMGMGLLKLGEDAVVLLSDFNLEGRKHAELRNIISKGRRNGLSFDVVPSSDVSDIMPQLKDISDEWI
ncbi:MAG: bifunctional lysylphosphatidylglycerol flippase/synthetase MprF, partial [Psychromonas sp.]|nr:bifunctional lysylphosphatidylglycerol flippase/synthetase MprF [Psychromonas sp.]